MSPATKPAPRRRTLDREFKRRGARRTELMGQQVRFVIGGTAAHRVHYTRWTAQSRLEIQLRPRGEYHDACAFVLVGEWKPLPPDELQAFMAEVNAPMMAAARARALARGDGNRDATAADLRDLWDTNAAVPVSTGSTGTSQPELSDSPTLPNSARHDEVLKAKGAGPWQAQPLSLCDPVPSSAAPAPGKPQNALEVAPSDDRTS